MASPEEQVRRFESTVQDLRNLITRFQNAGQVGTDALRERLEEALEKVIRDETALESAQTMREEARKQQEDAASEKERVRLRTDEQRQVAQSLDAREKQQLGQISKLVGAQQKATDDLTAALNSFNINAASNSKSLQGSSTTISKTATEFRSHLGELKSSIGDLSSASTTSKNDLTRVVEEFKNNFDPLVTSLEGSSTSLEDSSRTLSTQLFNMGSTIKDVQPHLQQLKADTARLTAASTTAQDTNSQLASAVQGVTAVLQENQTLRDTLQKEQAKVTQQQQELDTARQMLGDHRGFQAFKEALQQERDAEVNRLKQEIAGLNAKISGWEKGHADRLKEFDDKKQTWLGEADRRDRLVEDRVRQIESKQVELAKDLLQTHDYVVYAKSIAEKLKAAPELLEQKYNDLSDELESVEHRLQTATDELRGYKKGLFDSAEAIDAVNNSAFDELDAAKALRDELRDEVRRFEERFPEFFASLMLNSGVQYKPGYRGLRRDLENVERGLSPRSLAGVKEEMDRQRRLSPGGLAGVQGEIGRQSRPFSIGSGASDDEPMGLGIEDPDPTQSSVGKRGYKPSSVDPSPQKEPRAKKVRGEPMPESTLSPIPSASPEDQRRPKPRPQKSMRLQSSPRTTGPRVSLFESTSLSQAPSRVARPARQPIPSFQPPPTTASHASSSSRQSAVQQGSASASRDQGRQSTTVSTSSRRRSIDQGEGQEAVPELQEEGGRGGEIGIGNTDAQVVVQQSVKDLWDQLDLDSGIERINRVRLADWMAGAQKKRQPGARPGHIIRDCADNTQNGVQVCLTSRLRGKSGVRFEDREANQSCAICGAQFPCLRVSWVSNQAMNDEELPIRWLVQQRDVPS